MMAHDAMDMANRISMTICTSGLASKIRLVNDSCDGCTGKDSLDYIRKCGWLHAIEVDTGNGHLGTHYQPAGFILNLLGKNQRGSLKFSDLVAHHQLLVKAGGMTKIDIHMTHHEGNGLRQPDILFNAQTSQPFGTRSFQKFQIVGMVDDATRIRVFVIDTNWKLKY